MKLVELVTQSYQTPVLIVGFGPTGCMASATLARYGVPHMVVDMKTQRCQTGHACGIQPATQEILHTLGLQSKFMEKANRVYKFAFWSQKKGTSTITRDTKEHEVIHETVFPYLGIIGQGETEQIFEDSVKSFGINPKRGHKLLRYEYVAGDYPIKATVLNEVSGFNEIIYTKYMLGCDGSHSRVREAAGIKRKGQFTEDYWAVMDCEYTTDFPDYQYRVSVRAEAGALMLVPNFEGKRRVYTLLGKDDLVQLDEYRKENGDQKDAMALFAILQERMNKVMAPYKIEVNKVHWISQYPIAQRLAEKFWDGKNLYLLGDSVHTHSPKAAQGMNTGMNDAYNFTWKLAMVLKGTMCPSYLESYVAERQGIAQQLIDFDASWSSNMAKCGNEDDILQVFRTGCGFTSGLQQDYNPGKTSLLRLSPHAEGIVCTEGARAPLKVGRRLASIPLLRGADGWDLNLLDDMPSNCKFRVIYLHPENDPHILQVPTDLLEFVDVLVIAADLEKVELEWLPTFKTYTDHKNSLGLVYGLQKRAVVLVRPDGYVAMISPADQDHEVWDFLMEICGAIEPKTE